MSDTYKIRPLEWNSRHHNSMEGPVQYATSAAGEMVIAASRGADPKWFLNGIPYRTEANAKSAAQLIHEARLEDMWLICADHA